MRLGLTELTTWCYLGLAKTVLYLHGSKYFGGSEVLRKPKISSFLLVWFVYNG